MPSKKTSAALSRKPSTKKKSPKATKKSTQTPKKKTLAGKKPSAQKDKKKTASAASKKKKPSSASKWLRTGKKMRMADGKMKTIFKNSVTGEPHVRKTVVRGGEKVVKYVKCVMRGGYDNLKDLAYNEVTQFPQYSNQYPPYSNQQYNLGYPSNSQPNQGRPNLEIRAMNQGLPSYLNLRGSSRLPPSVDNASVNADYGQRSSVDPRSQRTAPNIYHPPGSIRAWP